MSVYSNNCALKKISAIVQAFTITFQSNASNTLLKTSLSFKIVDIKKLASRKLRHDGSDNSCITILSSITESFALTADNSYTSIEALGSL